MLPTSPDARLRNSRRREDPGGNGRVSRVIRAYDEHGFMRDLLVELEKRRFPKFRAPEWSLALLLADERDNSRLLAAKNAADDANYYAMQDHRVVEYIAGDSFARHETRHYQQRA